MTYRAIFHREAEKEYYLSFEWYEEQQEGLGERFEREIESLLKRILEQPEQYHYSNEPYREAGTDTFPYRIVYKVDKAKGVVYIAAVYHRSRNPKSKYRK